MKLCLSAVACTFALALPASAGAAVCAPPGVSGVNQYVEVVPGPGCNHPSSGPGSGNSSGGGHHSLPPGTQHQLTSHGSAGRAVAALVAASGTTAPVSSPRRGGGNSGAGSTPQVSGASASRQVPSTSGRGPLSALLHAVATGAGAGGLGALLPAFLAGVVVALGAVALMRRRRLSQ